MHEIPVLDRQGLRHFALTTGGIIAALFGLILPWLFGWSIPWWPFIVAAALIPWGLIAPQTLRPLYHGWMRLGLLLNRVTTPLILGLVFLFVFVPMGMMMRLFGRDPLHRRLNVDTPTYRERSRAAAPATMERPF